MTMSQDYCNSTSKIAKGQNSRRKKAARYAGEVMGRKTALFRVNASRAELFGESFQNMRSKR